MECSYEWKPLVYRTLQQPMRTPQT